MNITIATITALLLLLPGIGFVVGVNFADKNVREIVFRNTPAEIGYVIIVSLLIHFVFALPPWGFNASSIVLRYADLIRNEATADSNTPRYFFLVAIGYFLVTAVVGSGAGYYLAGQVRKRRLEFFAKHRWMLDLVGIRRGDVVYARILLIPHFTSADVVGTCAVVLEGILYDSFFQADGTLLYLAFSSFKEMRTVLGTPPYISGQLEAWNSNTSRFDNDRLLVEGRSISMARYRRFPAEAVSQPTAIQRIQQRLRIDRAAPASRS